MALDGWENLRDWFRPEETGVPTRRRTSQLALEAMETRWVPNDVFGLLGTPILGTGLASLGTDFLTPAAVLARGWSGGRSVNDLLGTVGFFGGGERSETAHPAGDNALVGRSFAASTTFGNVPIAEEVETRAAPPLAAPSATWPELSGPTLFTASNLFRDPLADGWSSAAAGSRSLVLPATLGGMSGSAGAGGSGAAPAPLEMPPYLLGTGGAGSSLGDRIEPGGSNVSVGSLSSLEAANPHAAPATDVSTLPPPIGPLGGVDFTLSANSFNAVEGIPYNGPVATITITQPFPPANSWLPSPGEMGPPPPGLCSR